MIVNEDTKISNIWEKRPLFHRYLTNFLLLFIQENSINCRIIKLSLGTLIQPRLYWRTTEQQRSWLHVIYNVAPTTRALEPVWHWTYCNIALYNMTKTSKQGLALCASLYNSNPLFFSKIGSDFVNFFISLLKICKWVGVRVLAIFVLRKRMNSESVQRVLLGVRLASLEMLTSPFHTWFSGSRVWRMRRYHDYWCHGVAGTQTRAPRGTDRSPEYNEHFC